MTMPSHDNAPHVTRYLLWAVMGSTCWVLFIIWMVVSPTVWGDTTTRCKPSGFQSGAVFRAADADCLDTSPRNIMNSQLSDVNIRAGAAIQGNKIDGVFSSIISTQVVSFLMPGVGLSAINSINAIPINAPQLTIGSLFSSRLQSLGGGEGVAVATLRLWSNSVDGTAPQVNQAFAESFPKAFARITCNGCASFPEVSGGARFLSSFNINAVLWSSAGVFLVSLRTPMLDSFYLVQATINPEVAGGSSGLTADGRPDSARYFYVYTYNATGTLSANGWHVTVWGRQ